MRELIDILNKNHTLSIEQWKLLLKTFTSEDAQYAAYIARNIAKQHFGNKIYFRGIIEFTNYCKNDCLYCGIRRSNQLACRYRLTDDDILECCEDGYTLGFRTFVLQGGEDAYFNDDRLVAIISEIHHRYPDCAITLSVGERDRNSYQKLFDAGSTRYLLRHETANSQHYGKLHPPELLLKHRIDCLHNLKDIGFQTGCGCMVGSPYQNVGHLAEDMVFMEEFKPQMIGIGPFIPHKDTPFASFPSGDTETTLFMLSLCRIMLPDVLLPSTTALGTVQGNGRQLGVLAGANVIMPNLSPIAVRQKYMLYNNKIGTDDDAASGVRKLKEQMQEIGYEIIVDRGDYNEKGMTIK